MIKYLLKIGAFVFVIFVSWLTSDIASTYIHAIDLTSILSVLQNISIAIFTLSGIWIAYLYPEAISAYADNNKILLINDLEDIKRVESLVLTIIVSALILLGILFYNLVYSFFSNHTLVLNNIESFKSMAIFYVVLLSSIEILVVISILKNNISFVNRLHKERSKRLAENKL